jgi:biopolymer transport protein ExbB
MIYGVILQIVQSAGTFPDTLKETVTTVSEQAARVPVASLSIWELTLKGGLVMIPIALLSLICIYIFIERYIIIANATRHDTEFMNNIRDFMKNDRLDSALSLCQNTYSPLARMIEKGLMRIGRPLSDINTAIENVGTTEVAKLEKNISLLGTVAGAAPMLGFLGTVTGMVKAFYDMSVAGNNLTIQILSGGIYQALITTVAGLIVGIVAYFCYNLLVAKIRKIVLKMQLRAAEFMDLLHEPSKK